MRHPGIKHGQPQSHAGIKKCSKILNISKQFQSQPRWLKWGPYFLLVDGLTIWQLLSRYRRGLADHLPADYLHSQGTVFPLCVFLQAITACVICTQRQRLPFIWCCVEPSSNMLWHRKWLFLVSGYKLPYRDPFSDFFSFSIFEPYCHNIH